MLKMALPISSYETKPAPYSSASTENRKRTHGHIRWPCFGDGRLRADRRTPVSHGVVRW